MSKANQAKFKAAEKEKNNAARAMSSVLINSQFNQLGGYIADPAERDASVIEAIGNSPLFSSMGEHGRAIGLIGASAIREYEAEYGELPSDNMLAAAHTALDNLFSGVIAADAGTDQLLSSLNSDSLATSKGLEIRANVAAVTLPSILLNPMNDAITYIPNPKVNEVELFNIERIAGSTFGGLTKGDIINAATAANYSLMRQRYNGAAQPD